MTKRKEKNLGVIRTIYIEKSIYDQAMKAIMEQGLGSFSRFAEAGLKLAIDNKALIKENEELKKEVKKLREEIIKLKVNRPDNISEKIKVKRR